MTERALQRIGQAHMPGHRVLSPPRIAALLIALLALGWVVSVLIGTRPVPPLVTVRAGIAGALVMIGVWAGRVQLASRRERQTLCLAIVGITGELAESRQLFTTLATFSPAGIFRTDIDEHCTYVNAAWCKLSGLNIDDALDFGWHGALHPDDRERVLAERSHAFHHGMEYRGQYRFNRPDGSTAWVECVSGPDIRDGGLIAGFVGIVIDISELKALEFALESARDHAMDADRAKSSFLANMSHEIRTPMSAVIGFTDLLLLSELTGEQQRFAQLIADSGRAMMRLLNDILDLSKIDAGRMLLQPEPANIRDLLKSCIELVNLAVAQKGLALRCEFAADLPTHVLTDGLRVRQIVLNLLGNALKFTERGGITLRASRDPDRPGGLLITIEDTGVGIDQERQIAIFEEFVQADNTTARRHGGTGLGLAISSKLAHLMDGDISLESTLGHGSRFFVRFVAPAVGGSVDVGHAGAERGARRRSASVENILLVDDHDINLELMSAMFAKLGRTVEVAHNGLEAFDRVVAAKAAGRPFDLVLMDMQMPVMGGITATLAIRSAGLAADELPIIALSANAFAEDVAACVRAGMQTHLSKPVSLELLGAALERWSRSDIIEEAKHMNDTNNDAPTLQDRYLVRKADMFAALETLLRRDQISDEELEEFSSLVHKMAGIAGYFGDKELALRAGEIERGIPGWAAPDRHARFREAAAAMRSAA